ncbi:MAG: ABC transporter ATP-binding protein [Candidatus Bathyarchaeia archaeon]
MPPIISAIGLTKIYNGVLAVDGIDFEINRGECFGFLGPNGAGKTTTMKMIQCAIPKTSGRLFVNGMDVEERPREIKRILGVVPQENNLDPDFTVLKNLTVYARYYDIPRAEAERRALELLGFVQLYEKRDSAVDKLSGGMKRRLMLARALINDPEILIMDEPTTGLDPQARHAIWERIRALKREGATVVLTTHYMEEASQLCDRLVIMDLGKIIAEGSPGELIERHVGPEVVEVDSRPEVLGYVSREGEGYEEFGGRVHIFARDPKVLASKLMGICDLENIAIRRATLEDVFLKLTGKALRD